MTTTLKTVKIERVTGTLQVVSAGKPKAVKTMYRAGRANYLIDHHQQDHTDQLHVSLVPSGAWNLAKDREAWNLAKDREA